MLNVYNEQAIAVPCTALSFLGSLARIRKKAREHRLFFQFFYCLDDVLDVAKSDFNHGIVAPWIL